MSNGYIIDEDAAYDQLTRSEILNDQNGAYTFYVVACQHDFAIDRVGSHGGFIQASAKEAVDFAKSLNDTAPQGHVCRYVPMTVALPPRTGMALAQNQTQVPFDDTDLPPATPPGPADPDIEKKGE